MPSPTSNGAVVRLSKPAAEACAWYVPADSGLPNWSLVKLKRPSKSACWKPTNSAQPKASHRSSCTDANGNSCPDSAVPVSPSTIRPEIESMAARRLSDSK